MNRLEYLLSTPEHTLGSALYIANAYLQGTIGANTAIDAIQRNRLPRAKLVATEIASEELWHADPSAVPGKIEDITKHYQSIKFAADNLTDRDYETAIRADMRLAQLPLIEVMLGEERLPDTNTTKSAYEQLVEEGSAHVNEFHSIRENLNESTVANVRGVLGEMAVLLLAQRYAINNIGTESWTPLQSRFSEDHGGNCRESTLTPAWDMTVYTHLKPSPVEVAYKVQIKSSDVLNPSGTSVIHINPDLALKHDNYETTTKIISECCMELKKPELSKRITRNLNIRTDLLLDRIDETAP